MKQTLVLFFTLTLSAGLWAEEINAVKVAQNGTTDWYLLDNSNQIQVTFDNGNPVFPNKTYNLTQGAVETTFGTAPEDTWYTVRTDGVAGNWNTTCLENNIIAIDGATFWTVVGQDNNSFVLDEVTEPQAGHGYLIRFTKPELKVKYGSETADEPVTAINSNPVQGTYTEIAAAESNVLVDNYVVYNNQLCPVTGWVGMNPHRAYVVTSLVPNQVPAQAPNRARAYMPKLHQTPTGNYSLPYEGTDGIGTVKMIKDGQLIIIRDGKIYNARGMAL